MQTQHITVPIYNLGCGTETGLVEQVLARVPGVTHVYVNPATEMAYVEYDPVLADSTQLFAALEREGFGQAASRPVQPTQLQQASKHTLDGRRMVLAGGIWLAGLYALCVLVDLLFPNALQMYRVWDLMLIGFDWTQRGTLLLGFVEVFVYGGVSAGAFAALYNWLPARVGEAPAMTCCATQVYTRGQVGVTHT